MGRKSNKTLRDLSELGKEFDIEKLEKEMVSEKVEDKEKVDIKMNYNKPVVKVTPKEKIENTIKEIPESKSGNITLEQLKAELTFNKDSLFGGTKKYFDARIDHTQRLIKNLEEKLDSINKTLDILVNKEAELKRVVELEDKINKLQEILKM